MRILTKDDDSTSDFEFADEQRDGLPGGDVDVDVPEEADGQGWVSSEDDVEISESESENDAPMGKSQFRQGDDCEANSCSGGFAYATYA